MVVVWRHHAHTTADAHKHLLRGRNLEGGKALNGSNALDEFPGNSSAAEKLDFPANHHSLAARGVQEADDAPPGLDQIHDDTLDTHMGPDYRAVDSGPRDIGGYLDHRVPRCGHRRRVGVLFLKIRGGHIDQIILPADQCENTASKVRARDSWNSLVVEPVIGRRGRAQA